jgi:ABC-type sugar transport system substrate-binding protein
VPAAFGVSDDFPLASISPSPSAVGDGSRRMGEPIPTMKVMAYMPQIRRYLFAVLAIAISVITVAACSSSGGSSSSSSSSSGSASPTGSASLSVSTGVQQAISLTKTLEQPFTSVGITTPVKGAIPTGKNIAIMVCGQPSCDVNYAYMSAAAKALGWTTTEYVAGPTPDKNSAAWNLVVQKAPSAVISIGFPMALWATQSKELAAKGIPVVECCTADSPGSNGVIAVINGTAAGMQGGKEQADWVVADSMGKADAVYLNISAYPILGEQALGFKDEMAKLCTTCTYNELDLNVAEVGTPAQTQAIVAYLQSHSKVKYIAAGDDDSLDGLPGALTAAGITGVKAIGLAPSSINLNYIKQGQVEVATIGFPNPELSWATIDVLARYFTHNSLAPDNTVLPRMILTTANFSNPNVIPVSTPSYQQNFLTLWGK